MALDGLINQSASVLIRYRVDTSEAKAGLKSLSGAEKEAAKARIAALEAGNKKIDDQAKGWQKVAGTIALAAGSVALAKAGLDAYGKTSAENAEKVKKITGAVGGAMDKLLSGIGSVVVAFGPVIEAVGEMVGLLGDAVSLVGDIVQAATQGEGVIDRMVKLSPEVQKYLRDHSVEGIKRRSAEAENADKPTVGGVVGGTVAIGADIQARASLPTGQNALMWFARGAASALGRGSGYVGATAGDAWANTRGSDEFEFDAMDMRRKPGATPRRGSLSTANVTDSLVAQLEAEIAAANAGALNDQLKSVAGSFPDASGLQMKDSPLNTEAMDLALEKLKQINELAARDEQSSFLEKTFGKIEEFDGYQVAFSALSAGVSSAMDAWITGSMSVGAAFKKGVADVMKTTATQAAVEALKSTAYGLFYSFVDPTKAAAAYASAAQWGVVAVAAGAAAKSLGGSGGSVGGGARPPTPGSSGGGSSGSGQPERIIIYGDTFAEETARNRSIRAQKMVDRAYSSSATENW